MMISKTTFVSMITTMCIAIDESRWMCENCKRLTENDKKELMEGCDYQKDLITMLTAITFDRFKVIRDYLYEYLAEESEGFCLIAKKDTQTN